MKKFIIENLVTILFVIGIILDTIYEVTDDLDLTKTQLNILKVVGVVLSILLKKLPELAIEAYQRKFNKYK